MDGLGRVADGDHGGSDAAAHDALLGGQLQHQGE